MKKKRNGRSGKLPGLRKMVLMMKLCVFFSVRFIFIGGGKRLFAEYQVIADETKCQRDRGLDRDQPKDRYAVFI